MLSLGCVERHIFVRHANAMPNATVTADRETTRLDVAVGVLVTVGDRTEHTHCAGCFTASVTTVPPAQPITCTDAQTHIYCNMTAKARLLDYTI